MKLSIIIPAFNEEKTIANVIEKLVKLDFEKELVIVDDGSSDHTREKLKKFEGNNNIKIIFHEKNSGKGAAIQTGLKECSGDYTIIQDADLEQNPDDLNNFFPYIEKGYQAIFGTRILEWGDEYNIRHTANLLFSFVTNILFKTHLTDVMTGYKMIKTDFFKSLSLKENRFGIEPEIAIRVIQNKKPIREVPISYTPRRIDQGKKIRFRDSFIVIWTILKNFFN